MSDLRDYDPACVLDRLPRKGPAIRAAIDGWLADVAPKLDGVRLTIIYSPYGEPESCREAYLAIRMRSGHLLTEREISPYVAAPSEEEDLPRRIIETLEMLHRGLIDQARQDPERWRRSVRNAYDY